ncbi:hypothetical protein CI109_101175 [Kwoniella shandongensis]|uniref:Uncharacterized protein n=1 Tax=Kwoniella shandongensis TaxID=1734106 RepID=A0A5M6C502_9TREE|nr:uncharacterized protein CI109_001644 [Kwoniella shandongensis]KAA5530237.1 hypothetical protein CI109_001644 [Kwoniella shandongensis]
MPAKRATTSGGARTKKAAGLQQPILAFQSQRKPSFTNDKSKPSNTKRSRPSLGTTPSISEVEISEPEAVEESHDATKPKPDAQSSQKRRQLDVKSKEWKGLMKEAKEAMGGMKPIHAGPETHNDVHHILRVFDMTSKYGPVVGITRLQRWERAKKWGLNPPEEIRTILTTEQGEDDVTYRENVLHGWL